MQPSGGALNGSIDHTTIQKMSHYGIPTLSGSAVYFTVTNSAIVNAAMSGVYATAGAVLEIDSSSVTNNNTAFYDCRRDHPHFPQHYLRQQHELLDLGRDDRHRWQ